MVLDARNLLLAGCRGYSSVGRPSWTWDVCVIWVAIWETTVETHALRDAGGNGGYVRLDGKLISWLFEDNAAPHTASSRRNGMNKRHPGLCMPNHEYGLREPARMKNGNEL